LEFCDDRLIVAAMFTILSAMVSLVSFRFRRRASLELEVLALRHQVAVLHRQQTGRARLGPGDRLLWAWLYRAWPRCLKVMMLVKPATVIQWHRQRFRSYWRWRSCSRRVGRPGVNREIRDLIRQMSVANPLWGAPRIHGEMLKLGIEVSQATVGRHMVRRHGPPSPTWRAFLYSQVDGVAAIDMFVVVTAAFRLLYVSVILSHARRKILHLNVTQHPTTGWLSRQITEAFP
jgi:putative transposase